MPPLWLQDREPDFQAPRQHVHDENCQHDHDQHDHGHGDHHHAPMDPYVRGAPKIGRNDPCPCGSGKKHKKCCLASA